MSSTQSSNVKPRAQDLSLRHLLDTLAAALRFLTVVPVPAPRQTDEPLEAIAIFPFVGLLLGLAVALGDWLMDYGALPQGSRSVIDIVVLVILTRGMPLKGLMDACDGLFSGHTPDERLMFMRDNRLGSYAVIGCVVILLLKIGLLDSLSDIQRTATLILVPVLGRWALVLSAVLFPPAHPEGRSAAYSMHATKSKVAIAAITTVLITGLTGGIFGALALVAVCLAVWVTGSAILDAIPGMTPDTLNLITEVAEVITLLFLSFAH